MRIQKKHTLPAQHHAWLRTLRPNTRRAYERAWHLLLEYTGGRFADLTARDLVEWRQWLVICGYSESSIAQHLAGISAYYRAANGPPGPNPAAAVERPRVRSRRRTGALTLDQAQALLRASDPQTPWGQRNWLMVAILLTTGRRPAALCGLRFGDVREVGGRVFWAAPGDEPAEGNRLPMAVWDAVLAYLQATGRLATMGPDDWVFTALCNNASRLPGQRQCPPDASRPLSEREVTRVVKQLARRAGMDPRVVTPSALRFTAAHLQRRAGASLDQVAALLGVSVSSARKILHRSPLAGQDVWMRVADMLGLSG